MSGLLDTLNNGVQSATYNPAAEKARKEAEAATTAALQEYRKNLISSRDALTQKRTVYSKYLYTLLTAKIDDGFVWIQSNSSSTAEVVNRRNQSFMTDQPLYIQQNPKLKALEYAQDYINVLSNDKDINADQKSKLASLGSTIKSFLGRTPTATVPTVDELQRQIASVQDSYQAIFPGKDFYVDSSSSTTSSIQDKQARQKKEEASTFSIKRLFSQIWSTASNVFNSLLIIVLFLVSGMLTANDAIGREWPYRILYFIYGGVFFPVMLIYYLYMWFLGSAPRIYTLLPVSTFQATTSLARFFLFPVTFVPDEYSEKAYNNFMTTAAELVGKKYTPGESAIPAAAAAAAAVAGVAGVAGVGAKGTGAKALKIAEAIEALSLTPITGLPVTSEILKSMEGLRLK